MPNLKSLVNSLPDDPVCDCDGATAKQVLDAQLAELQAYIDGGGCLRSWFLKSGILGLIGTAMMLVDDAGALTFADGSTAMLSWRPVEPGTFPLAHGIPGRVGRLRAYGETISPAVAQAVAEAYLEHKGWVW